MVSPTWRFPRTNEIHGGAPCWVETFDYIVSQPHSDAKRWEGEVKKMISVYGAPIDEADAKVIVEYLATAYGPAKANQKKDR